MLITEYIKDQFTFVHSDVESDIVVVRTSITRKSSCVNARGIPTAAYQVLHMLSYPGVGGRQVPWLGGGSTLGYPLSWPGWGGRYLGWRWGIVTLGYVPPLPCGQTKNITFPHPSDAIGKNHLFQYSLVISGLNSQKILFSCSLSCLFSLSVYWPLMRYWSFWVTLYCQCVPLDVCNSKSKCKAKISNIQSI